MNDCACRICGARNPQIISLLCFSHQAASICGDLITLSPNSSIIDDTIHVANFINRSSLKWLPRLRNIMCDMHGRTHELVTGFVIRWESMWMRCCSVLRAHRALVSLFVMYDTEVNILIGQKSHKGLQRTREIVHNEIFWSSLTSFLRILIQSIETTLILQSGKCTFDDVLYCVGRH